ncbi:gamma-glutamyltranspeptidase [Ancylostoma caninum]|uniref:Gamma-glutamyltranspeptidase n=1 Tax=Ancylostoma caninum TaxID=29170 RepID=A0A368FCV8_ANCCA|nr:gamma-glutamyltranspeptidase [Ancylostoma caninum]
MREFINPKTGNVYRTGEQIKTRKSLLNTLRRLANASNPLQEFYEGEMAREMASEFQRYGGILTEADFASYRSLVIPSSDVIYTNLKNDRVICGPPPPSGSAVAQAILNVMDGYKYNMKKFEDVSLLYHHFIESSKFAYAARSWLGDPAFVHNATDIARNITTKEWAEWEYLTELTARGHVLSKVNNLTVVTAVERDSDGQVYANSDFRKGEESAPAGY